MKKYDLKEPEELGRLAGLICEAVGKDVSFVFSFRMNVENGSGAITNVSPDDAASILGTAGLQFLDSGDFKEMIIRDN